MALVSLQRAIQSGTTQRNEAELCLLNQIIYTRRCSSEVAKQRLIEISQNELKSHVSFCLTESNEGIVNSVINAFDFYLIVVPSIQFSDKRYNSESNRK